MSVNQLPDVGRIQGVVLSGGKIPETKIVHMQYTDERGHWHELQMPFVDAMYLLNLLRASQLDLGYEMPEDPRTP